MRGSAFSHAASALVGIEQQPLVCSLRACFPGNGRGVSDKECKEHCCVIWSKDNFLASAMQPAAVHRDNAADFLCNTLTTRKKHLVV